MCGCEGDDGLGLDALPERIRKRIRVCQETGCWLWVGNFYGNGYGQIWSKGQNRRAHRVVWELLKAPIKVGRVLDHKCVRPACVRPLHLHPVTQKRNVQLIHRRPRRLRVEQGVGA